MWGTPRRRWRWRKTSFRIHRFISDELDDNGSVRLQDGLLIAELDWLILWVDLPLDLLCGYRLSLVDQVEAAEKDWLCGVSRAVLSAVHL